MTGNNITESIEHIELNDLSTNVTLIWTVVFVFICVFLVTHVAMFIKIKDFEKGIQDQYLRRLEDSYSRCWSIEEDIDSATTFDHGLADRRLIQSFSDW